ncbi:hypothetical protein HGRIS_002485 [Hohenbuehelia grisea]|uniref:VanZ-like domain-containing protein n=1 Tax=Hohenbuehelia grisea TaxID=104357 RepID=A0ABR3JL49_9AGAR
MAPGDDSLPSNARKTTLRKTARVIMRSYSVQIPKYDMPIRLRPWFLLFTCIVMVILAFLGFTNFSHALPLNDKLLHFICFSIATAVFYFIIDVEEEARRVWLWRHAGLLFTGFVCFFCGGILSEFVQSMLPYKVFQFGDVVANLLGSSLGLFIAYHLEKYYRYRREIARLYRPLDMDSQSDSEDDEDDVGRGIQLLPTYNTPERSGPQKTRATRLADVWDEREELFGIGGDSDDEGSPNVFPSRGTGQRPPVDEERQIPKIMITSS